jgi:hypothetical protein
MQLCKRNGRCEVDGVLGPARNALLERAVSQCLHHDRRKRSGRPRADHGGNIDGRQVETSPEG